MFLTHIWPRCKPQMYDVLFFFMLICWSLKLAELISGTLERKSVGCLWGWKSPPTFFVMALWLLLLHWETCWVEKLKHKSGFLTHFLLGKNPLSLCVLLMHRLWKYLGFLKTSSSSYTWTVSSLVCKYASFSRQYIRKYKLNSLMDSLSLTVFNRMVAQVLYQLAQIG